jgi:hypothetical protein
MSEIQQARQTRKHLGVLEPESGELRLAAGKPEPSRKLLALLSKVAVNILGQS